MGDSTPDPDTVWFAETRVQAERIVALERENERLWQLVERLTPDPT